MIEAGFRNDSMGRYYILLASLNWNRYRLPEQGDSLKKMLVGLLILVAILAWQDWRTRAIEHQPGILVPETPRQMAASAAVMKIEGFRLSPRASLQMRARVLSRRDYRWGKEARLSPMDLALGWGRMSDQAVLDRIDISQNGRWYYTRYELPAPVSDDVIIHHSGNMHMIPADKWIETQLDQVRVGHIITLSGQLVDIDDDSGWKWRTSLSREDTGSGSCEILYVEHIELAENPDMGS